MNTDIRQTLQSAAEKFRMPKYADLPNIGLYLDQVVKYINQTLGPIGCAEITTSMISNYVKKGLIESPQNKQYDADRIAHLMFLAVVKHVLPLENIANLFDMQKKDYDLSVAYDYFCSELENMIFYVFGLKPEPEKNLGITAATEEKDLLRNVIISVSHSLYISAAFNEISREKTKH